LALPHLPQFWISVEVSTQDIEQRAVFGVTQPLMHVK
jgi:hypothetical protein